MRALTIHQPWAWLIAEGIKDIENRRWETKYRGPLLIHSGKSRRSMKNGLSFANMAPGAVAVPDAYHLKFGKIIAVVELVDIVQNDASYWAESGCFNWKLSNAKRLDDPIDCRGHMGLFDPPENIMKKIKEQL